jgi:hypothetical protein
MTFTLRHDDDETLSIAYARDMARGLDAHSPLVSNIPPPSSSQAVMAWAAGTRIGRSGPLVYVTCDVLPDDFMYATAI